MANLMNTCQSDNLSNHKQCLLDKLSYDRGTACQSMYKSLVIWAMDDIQTWLDGCNISYCNGLVMTSLIQLAKVTIKN
jgi:hypothetical protein